MLLHQIKLLGIVLFGMFLGILIQIKLGISKTKGNVLQRQKILNILKLLQEEY